MALKIASLNVNGLNNIKKRKSIFNEFKTKKYDVIFLQETHSTNKTEKLWELEWGGQFFTYMTLVTVKAYQFYLKKNWKCLS